MKKFFINSAFLACCMISGAYAAGYAKVEPEYFMGKCAEQIIEDRVYLKPGCVFVSTKDIFIKVDDDIAAVEAIYCDENGIYVYDYQLSSLIYCYECHRYFNPKTDSVVCPHLPRSKK